VRREVEIFFPKQSSMGVVDGATHTTKDDVESNNGVPHID